MYRHEHNKDMTTMATAAMLSTILYYRRFFPYYVYNIVAGIDDEGMTSFRRLMTRSKRQCDVNLCFCVNRNGNMVFKVFQHTVITPCFRTPFVFGHPLFFTEIINFLASENMFFEHPLFSDIPYFSPK